MSIREPLENEVIQQNLQDQAADLPRPGATLFTCPDCGGTLWQADEEGILRFQCHVGHGWSWEALLGQKSDQLEATLWAASRLLVERAILQRQIATRLQSANGDLAHAAELEELAVEDERKSRDVQDMLEELALVASAMHSKPGITNEDQISALRGKEPSNVD